MTPEARERDKRKSATAGASMAPRSFDVSSCLVLQRRVAAEQVQHMPAHGLLAQHMASCSRMSCICMSCAMTAIETLRCFKAAAAPTCNRRAQCLPTFRAIAGCIDSRACRARTMRCATFQLTGLKRDMLSNQP